MNVEKQVAYWRESADEDWEAGVLLVENGKTRQGLFLIHLALEKILKAHVCRIIKDHSPRIHALVRLAEITGLNLQAEQKDVLTDINRFSTAGRYPGVAAPAISREQAKQRMAAARGVYEWLNRQL